jgi:ABC-2 type transport system permease protein
MSLLLHQTRFDLLGVARDKRARFMGLAFPLLLLVVLSGISGDATTTVDGHTVSLKAFYLPGVVTMSLLMASYGSLVVIAVAQRETGVFKRRRATPLPAWTLIAGRALATLVAGLVSSVVLLLVARFAFDVTVSASGLLAFLVLGTVAVVAYSCLAYGVSSLVRTVEATQPVVQITLLPLYFISGIWFTTDDMPEGLRRVAEVLPIEPLAHGLHTAAMGGGIEWGSAARLLLWGAIGLVVAARRFSWLPKSA